MAKSFPEGFLWGTATASFQIEGATKADGRGESIWDRFCDTPGKVLNGDKGDPACESYTRYSEDIALMQAMHNNAYRFSIAWPRIIPDGDGAVNKAGLAYYEKLVDGLLAAGITPLATLYHWDLPQALQDQGGWANRATVDAFERYVRVVVERLADRVKLWATLNEPWCISILSNELGEHAPGLQDRKLALQVAHNALVAHGRGFRAIQELCPDGKAGIVLNMWPVYPELDTESDHALAGLTASKNNRWFLEPLLGLGYPQDAWDAYGADVPVIEPGDLDMMTTDLDFLGLNYYTRTVIHDPNGGDGRRLYLRDQSNVSARDWETYPLGLYDLLLWLHREYPQLREIYVTENGMACRDMLENGAVHDPERTSYLRGHIAAIHDAMLAGVAVKGYFVWSLMDNFEWAFGYDSRFGLAYVDFATQQRTLKDSAYWYSRVAAANALIE